MDTKPNGVPGPAGISSPLADLAPGAGRRIWPGIRARMLGGLLLVLPILITLWVISWLYSSLEKYVIDPLALVVIWKGRVGQPDAGLPSWFENYAAPLIALVLALVLLYCCGFFVNSRAHRVFDWVLLRVPGISVIYDGIRNVFQALEKRRGQQRLQRAVLVAFPHPGMRVPAFVTATCRDIETQKAILCVFVPVSPLPTSGFLLLVPEDEVTELKWTPEQTWQAIISAGLTAPPDVRYFRAAPAAQSGPVPARATPEVRPEQQTDGPSPLP
jgi:uncharacterized membrane protein